MSKGFASSYRVVLLAAAMFACFGALGVRLVWLHVVDREKLLRQAERARHGLIVQNARRGDILDARGAILATSRSVIKLGVDPWFLRPQDETNWPRLAELLGMPEPELRRIFITRWREVRASPSAPAATALEPALLSVMPLAETDQAATEDTEADGTEFASDGNGRKAIKWAPLGDDVSESLYAEIEALHIRGVYGNRVFRRAYPNNQLAAHLIGFVNRDQRAVTGVEYHADFYLRGQNGWRIAGLDGLKRETAQFSTREVPPSNGYDVVLSIDSAVQDIVERELVRIAEEFAPRKASIVVSDPRTGFILGLANHPTFDLNAYNLVPREEQGRMRNIAVTDIYEPGSVFKIVAASAALEEGLVTPLTRFNVVEESVEYRGRTVRLPGEDHDFGSETLTVAEIVSRSSNRGAARLGIALGPGRLYRYARAFGFGRPLGFPVGGEVAGLLAAPEKWSLPDITRIPMGHAIAVTVLQMHQAMSVIASGGALLRPQIIRQIRDPNGEVVFHRRDGVVIERVVSPRTAGHLAAMLRGVAARHGTAPAAAIEGYDVAGKTGTTQKLETITLPDGRQRQVYSSDKHVSSFVGFFPAGRPQVAISVVVDEARMVLPGRIAYGGTVAAPSFRRVGVLVIPVLDIKPDRTTVLPQFAAAGLEGIR